MIGGPEPLATLGLARGAEAAPELPEAARRFETYLVGELLRQGSKPLVETGILDGGRGGRLFRELFHEELARVATLRGDFGIAGMIESQARPADTTAEEDPGA